jgi:hypothetical protein
MRQTFTPIVVNHPQRSEEWYAARLGNVTASRAADTMSYYAVQKNHLVKAAEFYALNPHFRGSEWQQKMLEQYPVEYCLTAGIELKESAARQSYRQSIVTERLTGLPGDLDPYVTKDMQWGVINEKFARTLYGIRYNMKVEDAPLMLHPTLLCGASPDGLPIDKKTGELGNLEIKCLSSKNHLYKVIMEDTMPADYWEQIQMQMWITGRDWCDFVGYDSRVKEHLQLFVRRVEYDEFYVDNVLVPSIRRFLDECDKDERMFYAIMRRKEEESKELNMVI